MHAHVRRPSRPCKSPHEASTHTVLEHALAASDPLSALSMPPSVRWTTAFPSPIWASANRRPPMYPRRQCTPSAPSRTSLSQHAVAQLSPHPRPLRRNPLIWSRRAALPKLEVACAASLSARPPPSPVSRRSYSGRAHANGGPAGPSRRTRTLYSIPRPQAGRTHARPTHAHSPLPYRA
ncbi:hypothetical protein BC628DRAFT_1006034 [Trametes gibbosa]|nr:hypothetical protein BC628DRAFT_1006034 [Trametes gibbosa]